MSYVQVLNMDNSPCVFEGRRDNVFSSINEAIRNILTYNTYSPFKIKLFGKFFNEYVILPTGVSLRFSTDMTNCHIRAIKSNHSINSFTTNITIDHVIDGVLTLRDTLNYIQNQKSPIKLYKKIKDENPELISSIIINNFFDNFKQAENILKHMLLSLEEKTMNLQILLLTRALKEDIHFLNRKIGNLALNNDQCDTYWEGKLQGTKQFQKLLEKVIIPPQKELKEIDKRIDTENLLKTIKLDEMKTMIETNNKEYRELIYKILFRIQELLYTYNYSLDKFTDYLKETNDSYLLYCLNPLDKQFKDIITGFDTLNRYIHGLGDNNQFIINGVNSSIILLKLAEQNINGIHGTEFKETIIDFLNKYDKSLKNLLKIDSSNQEVINTLREFNKNCPDADYRLIRYIKDHPQGFEVVSTFASIIGVIEAIATLTGMGIKLFKD